MLAAGFEAGSWASSGQRQQGSSLRLIPPDLNNRMHVKCGCNEGAVPLRIRWHRFRIGFVSSAGWDGRWSARSRLSMPETCGFLFLFYSARCIDVNATLNGAVACLWTELWRPDLRRRCCIGDLAPATSDRRLFYKWYLIHLSTPFPTLRDQHLFAQFCSARWSASDLHTPIAPNRTSKVLNVTMDSPGNQCPCM